MSESDKRNVNDGEQDDSEIPVAIWTGEIFGIPCAVLPGGKRVVDLNAFMAKLETLTDPNDIKAMAAFARGTGVPNE